ncbi:putative membrane protein [Nakamurella flavida]|uniref:glutamine amidotransferase n=1 Tax=Nakamurella flavida TaxID=363630 RepID=UPI00278AAB21|nr:glutamine amidotransferase [Nakamurella flavida]MDP9778524.1 putative membrane protein [Nakamurella flavida]
MARILFAGESWSVTSTHAKGFDTFTTTHYAEGGDAIIAAWRDGGHEVTYQPSHVAATEFPTTVEELDQWDVVVLSDIGSNTLLLPASTFQGGRKHGNRLTALRDWTLGGGGFAMIGGYLTFQGIEAKANYRTTPVADVLPIVMEIGDDRVERPDGVRPVITGEHVTVDGLAGVGEELPELLGYQRFVARPGASTLMTVDDEPLLVVGEAGRGRTLAYASDIGPHWAPTEFTDWPGFATMWQRAATWLAGQD